MVLTYFKMFCYHDIHVDGSIGEIRWK